MQEGDEERYEMNNDLEKFSEERLMEIQKKLSAGVLIDTTEASLVRDAIEIAVAANGSNYDITVYQLRDYLHYDPVTGIFTRRSDGLQIGSKNDEGYLYITCFGHVRPAHRMAYYYMTGRLPKTVDHIDRVKTNNEWKNLREATNAENQWNKAMKRNNTSGVKGVYWSKKDNRWIAEIRLNGARHYVGSYRDMEDAKLAISEKRKVLHGAFFVEDGQVAAPKPESE
ncbi:MULTISPECIES: HNH endonuclease [Rahnella]|uniref:HNH endonuclease n=1 Tax=Rahnella laticis TaxID=2787622 RepID=A0ABS0DZU4_9GAMM|nr:MULTISPECIES: HNH endonuclease [Rahnella]MBF7978096.1 HNH endonuclease [Rahnella laticis]MBF7998187.1 HNH endonuclease [Rahnella sp. LAC-M12]